MIARKCRVLLGAAALLLLVACSSPTLPAGAPTIVGPIVALGQTGGSLWTVHVKQSAGDPCGVRFTINGATRLLHVRADGSVSGAALSDLAVGRTARVWAAGVVLDSCPGQAEAGTIAVQE